MNEYESARRDRAAADPDRDRVWDRPTAAELAVDAREIADEKKARPVRKRDGWTLSENWGKP